jgi:hypothetical protein
LRLAPVAGGFEALRSVVESVHDGKPLFVLDFKQAGIDGFEDAPVDGADRVKPLAHVERTKFVPVSGDTGVRGDWLRVHEDPARGEGGVNVAQSVHDALERDASQRPAAERDIESLARKIESLCIVNAKPNAPRLLFGERRASGRDVLGTRVEGVDGRAMCGCERGEATLSATDVEDALAVERNKCCDRGDFDPRLVATVHRLPRVRLVRLEGRAAGTVLQRLAARVFEGRAGISVNELAGLDPLEAVAF